MRLHRLLPACALAPLLCAAAPAAAPEQTPPVMVAAPDAPPPPVSLPTPVPLPAARPAAPVRTASAIVSPALVLPPSDAPLAPAAVSAEAARLRADLAREVPALLTRNPARERALVALLRQSVAAGDFAIDHPQLLVAVDRNARVQQLSVVLARPAGAWEVLGTVHVSTGQAGRFDHYITPLGVFPHTDLILDYRAEGTFNENHIRGLGLKGMRVWDFGWQWAHRGWGADASPIQIRLEMHATDPSVLAQRIGHTASQGCVRIPDAMNRFLDHHGVLDAEYERAAVDEIRYRALLLPDRVPTPLAGNALVVVDSSGAP
ncbi:MAG: L,D-transpeptidase [Janthinobacterium lividum]